MTEGDLSTESTPSSSKICSKLKVTRSNPMRCGQLFGPFVDPLSWLSYKHLNQTPENQLDVKCIQLFKHIDIARHPKEQNVEIIIQNGAFFFRLLQDIDPTNKLYAWFNDTLLINLPSPSCATLNGTKRYYCGLCSQVFNYPNPVIIHLLLECPKSIQFKPEPPKKRRFDIDFLVNDDNEKKLKIDPNNNSSNNNKDNINNNYNNINNNIINNGNNLTRSLSFTEGPSAFHKVDWTRPFFTPLTGPLLSSPSSSPSSLITTSSLALTSPVLSSVTSSAVALSSLSSSILNGLASSNTLTSSSASSLLSSNTLSSSSSSQNGSNVINGLSSSLSSSSIDRKTIIPSTLMPFLPPSLAALSFPQTNWCAKCNATFRMTSDLVYHMRSHHKKQIMDPLKKKREDKLRCNICGETFRERHHLTRHMTSHQ